MAKTKTDNADKGYRVVNVITGDIRPSTKGALWNPIHVADGTLVTIRTNDDALASAMLAAQATIDAYNDMRDMVADMSESARVKYAVKLADAELAANRSSHVIEAIRIFRSTNAHALVREGDAIRDAIFNADSRIDAPDMRDMIRDAIAAMIATFAGASVATLNALSAAMIREGIALVATNVTPNHSDGARFAMAATLSRVNGRTVVNVLRQVTERTPKAERERERYAAMLAFVDAFDTSDDRDVKLALIECAIADCDKRIKADAPVAPSPIVATEPINDTAHVAETLAPTLAEPNADSDNAHEAEAASGKHSRKHR